MQSALKCSLICDVVRNTRSEISRSIATPAPKIKPIKLASEKTSIDLGELLTSGVFA